MARKLKFDKEALIEFSGAYKDQLFLGLLFVALVGGGVYVWGQTSKSVGDIINEVQNAAMTPGGAGDESDVVNPEELVQLLTAKRSKDMYQVERNPFGSPEEQMRMREEVQSAYQRGVELFNSGRYQEALDQFDRVIQLDVTETRISYPVLPSEYKRRAMQENARRNMDQILTSAQNDVSEGDRLAQAGETDKALELYNRARNNLASVIDSDPDGSAIGEENLNRVKTLEQQAFRKFINLRGQTLIADLQAAMSNARQVLSGSDYIAMMKSIASLQRLQLEIQQIDPNAELVNRSTRSQVNSLATQIQQKINTNYSALVDQANRQFMTAIQDEDLVKSQESITVLSQARQMNPQDQTLAQTLTDYIKQRADLVIQQAQQFAVQQRDNLAKGDYASFDVQQRDRFIAELNLLLDRNVGLDDDKRGEVLNALNLLKQLRLPPPLTQKFEIRSIEPLGNSFKIEVRDKETASSRPRTIVLREGRMDASTKISLKQVDTQEGFVILSRSDYMDAKVPLNQSN